MVARAAGLIIVHGQCSCYHGGHFFMFWEGAMPCENASHANIVYVCMSRRVIDNTSLTLLICSHMLVVCSREVVFIQSQH
jgi:hypothetical protein